MASTPVQTTMTMSSSQVQPQSSGVVLVAKFDYSAKEPHELDLKKGERLFLIDNSKQWWLVRRLDAGLEQTGFVKFGFIRLPKSWFLSRLLEF